MKYSLFSPPCSLQFHNNTVAYSQAGIQKTRWTVAYAYAIGGNVLAPWDNYLPDNGQGRYYGNGSNFDDLFSFIRINPTLFDGAVRLESLNPVFIVSGRRGN